MLHIQKLCMNFWIINFVTFKDFFVLALIRMAVKYCGAVLLVVIMTPQVTSRREGGRALGGIPGQGVCGWKELKEANKPPRWPKYTKMAPKMVCFPHFLTKSPKAPFFTQKYIIRYTYSQDVFLGINEFLNFSLLQAMWSFTCSKFRESYTPSAIRIRVNFEIINIFIEPDHNRNSSVIYRKTATPCGDDVIADIFV
jgi:hypothetical protein